MSPEALDRSLRPRVVGLAFVLWAVVAGFSYVIVRTVFGLTADQQAALTWIFLGATLGVAGPSLVLVYHWVGPLEAWRRALVQGHEPSAEMQARAEASAAGLAGRLGLVGFIGPVLWAAAAGLALIASTAVPWKLLGYFVTLGLFDALFAGAMLFYVPPLWSRPILESLAQRLGRSPEGRGISLRWKILVLSSLLASLPTLLVGAMSFATANRLLDEEVGHGLQRKLLRLNEEIRPLLARGADRLTLERRLTEAAERIGRDSFVHLGLTSGAFYRSERAGSLSPQLYRRIRDRWQAPAAGERVAGNIVDASSGRAYTYAFSQDGGLVSIAPVRHARSRTTATLWWMIVGITLFSMLVAGTVGFVFSASMGDKIRCMANLTDEFAHGALQRQAPVVSDDELGELGTSLHAMASNLRRMVVAVAGLAGQIATTCNQLLVKASAISTGAELQSNSVAETGQSVEKLNANIRSASSSLEALVASAQEMEVAANKVGDGFSRMTDEASGLQTTIGHTGQLVERMVAAADEVAGNISDLSEGAGRSARSMQQVDRSITAITSSAADTASIAREAIAAAQDGAVAVRRTIEGMERIVDSTHQASEVINGLGNRVEDIGSILGVIEEIADQTNLLALNAAIIAAQAGEHGRSFAVVADEIRSLAERTSSSTREIGQLIADIQGTSEEANQVMRGGVGIVNEGMSLSRRAGDSLSQILVSVQKAAANVEEIARNTEGQTQASEQVTSEIARVADMASRITDVSVEQSRAGRQLRSAFQETLATGEALDQQINQLAQENRQAMAAVAATNEAAGRASKAVRGQSEISGGILEAIEQIREIGKNHAVAASEMGEATEALAEKSGRLQDEIEEFQK